LENAVTTRPPLGRIKGIRTQADMEAAARHLRSADPEADLSPALIRAIRATRAVRAADASRAASAWETSARDASARDED
jgi:hypothetical protein